MFFSIRFIHWSVSTVRNLSRAADSRTRVQAMLVQALPRPSSPKASPCTTSHFAFSRRNLPCPLSKILNPLVSSYNRKVPTGSISFTSSHPFSGSATLRTDFCHAIHWYRCCSFYRHDLFSLRLRDAVNVSEDILITVCEDSSLCKMKIRAHLQGWE